jgi:hypothetical protein
MGRMSGYGVCQWRDGTQYKGQWKNCVKDGHGELIYADGSTVVANFVDEMPEGDCKKTFPDGSTYKGKMHNGLFHGQGKYTQPREGSEYIGTWFKNEMRGQGVKKLRWGEVEITGVFNGQHVNGKGQKRWRVQITVPSTNPKQPPTKKTEWCVYKGELNQSQISGFGEFKWHDGRHYIGQFVNSQMHGNGKLSWPEPALGNKLTVYKGDMFANVIQGKGRLQRGNGDVYEGEFENALFNGEGVYLWQNKKIKYKGQFRNGLIHGHGVLHNVHGVYEGEFRKGLMSGMGVMTFYNGDKYSGEFTNSSMTGYGCYTFTDQTKLIGHFDDGVCNRHAKKVYKDGRIYIGEFNNDIENGKGILIDGDKKVKGIWKDAVLVEELVSLNIKYENNFALTRYAYSSQGTKKNDDEIILPSECKF